MGKKNKQNYQEPKTPLEETAVAAANLESEEGTQLEVPGNNPIIVDVDAQHSSDNPVEEEGLSINLNSAIDLPSDDKPEEPKVVVSSAPSFVEDDLDKLIEEASNEEALVATETKVFDDSVFDGNLELPGPLRIISKYSDFNKVIHPAKVMSSQNQYLSSAIYSILEKEEDEAVAMLRYAVVIMRNNEVRHVFSAAGMSKEINTLRWSAGQREEYESLIYIISTFVKIKCFDDLNRSINWEAFRTRTRAVNSERFTRILMKVAGLSI